MGPLYMPWLELDEERDKQKVVPMNDMANGRGWRVCQFDIWMVVIH
jgi:hypothetical protein